MPNHTDRSRSGRPTVALLLGLLAGGLMLAPASAHHDPGHTKKQIKKVKKQLKKASAALQVEIDEASTVFLVTVPQGTTGTTLISYPPLTIKGDCVEDGANLETHVYIETTEEGTAYGGDDNSQGSIGPGSPIGDRVFENPGAASTGAPDHSDGYDDQVNAVTPSGRALNATVSSVARNDANSCTFYGHWTKVA